jgi:hypothetical protein
MHACPILFLQNGVSQQKMINAKNVTFGEAAPANIAFFVTCMNLNADHSEPYFLFDY